MDREKFFDRVRKEIHPGGFTQEQVDGLNYLLDAFEEVNWPIYYASNALGTAWREVGGRYVPVREGFKKTDAEARAYVKKHYPHKYGVPTIYGGQYAYGRGIVQITWADPRPGKIDNYGKADRKLAEMGVIKKGDLLADFDLALDPKIAAKIMIYGMDEGWFTGKKNSDYLDRDVPDFFNARRIINGVDHADEIAEVSRKFLYALQAAGYGKPPVAAPKPEPVVPPPPPPPDVPKVKVPETLTLMQRLSRIFGGRNA